MGVIGVLGTVFDRIRFVAFVTSVRQLPVQNASGVSKEVSPMKMRPALCLVTLVLLTIGSSARSAELLAWNGGSVDLLNASTYTTPSASATGVVSGASGSKLGGLITISTILNTVTYAGGYLQFAITADGTHDLTIQDFRLTTSLVSVSALTTLSSASSEGGSYTDLASLATLSLGTNTYTLPTADTIAAGTTRYYRLTSLLAAFTYGQAQPAVLAFHGTVTPVPEPSTYAMAIMSAGTIGLAARHKKKRAAKV